MNLNNAISLTTGHQTADTIYNVAGSINLVLEPEINQVLASCESEVLDYIEQFDPILKERLLEAKEYIHDFLLKHNPEERKIFITRWKHQGRDPYAGIAGMWKFLLLCHVAYPEWGIDTSNITRNILVGNQWRRALYSCWGQQTMPRIIIRLASAQKHLIGLERLFPHRVIIVNSNSRIDPLCRHCGHQVFPFERILKDFGRGDDYMLFKGVGDKNNFGMLESIEVYDGECMFNEALQASDIDTLTGHVRSVL